MTTIRRTIFLSLFLTLSLGAAQAAEPEARSPNRSLHLAIATQGDQALLDIRDTMLASMRDNIRTQMSDALQSAAQASETTQARRIGANPAVVAKPDY